MPAKYRKKPLAQFEHGTRIYAPSTGETRYRVVATDPETGRRFSTKAPDEAAAYRQLVLDIADAVANAKGGIKPGETAAIDKIRQALGTG